MKSHVSLHLRAARAHRALELILDRELGAIGLSALDYEILAAIARDKRWSIASLGREVGAERSALSRGLRVLRKRGFVVLDRWSRNRTSPELSADGIAKLAEATVVWAGAEKKLIEQLGPRAGAARRALRSLTDPSLGAGDAIDPLPDEYFVRH
jgi:DNA-binding MarR family transcriptional regulator